MFLAALLVLLCSAQAVQPDAPPEPAVLAEVTDKGVVLTPTRQLPPDSKEAEKLLLEFGETSLYELTLFFADIMRKNFLLADDKALRSKTVMLIGHESMTLDEAWEAYLSALRAHDFTTSDTGELVTIVPTDEASSRSEGVRSGEPTRRGEAIVTQLLPVTNAQVADLLTVVKPLLSADAEVIAYAPGNTLIVTDSANNVAKINDLVKELAIAAPSSSLKLYPLGYAKAAEVSSVIEALYLNDTTKKTVPTRRTKPSSKSKSSIDSGKAGEEARHISKVIPDERTNMIIVLANPDGHSAVDDLVNQLDVDVDGRRSQLHIIRLKYALAEEIAAVLSHLQQTPTGKEAPTSRRPQPTLPETPDLAAALDSGARIAPDAASNSLAILAEQEDFDAIAELIAELDVARGQVFVDAVFVELTSTKDDELALSAHTLQSDSSPLSISSQTDPDMELNSFAVSPDLLSGLAAGVFGPVVDVLGPDGANHSVPTFGIALRALQTDSDVHVMGNPALLVLDHQEASLSVGRKIPFKTSSQLSTVGVPIESYDRVDVAMELKVTPHINDENLVTLDVELNVDEVEGAATESGLSGGPITSGRNVQSQVMVDNGQTIVIAGVTGTKVVRMETKVPILGSIPIIGALFRGKHDQTRQTNLMVFLTPHIVQTPADLIDIRTIKEAQRQEFVRRFQGKRGEEWLRELKGLLGDAQPLPQPSDT